MIVNSSHRPSNIIYRHRRHDLSMQDLTSLMEFLGKEIQKYPSSTTMISVVSIWSEIEFGMYSPFHTHATKRSSSIFFYISIHLPWTTWNAICRVFGNALRQISILFRTWRGQEFTWGVLCQILSFRRYWHWCHLQQSDLKSLSPPWINFSPILMMLWKRL